MRARHACVPSMTSPLRQTVKRAGKTHATVEVTRRSAATLSSPVLSSPLLS
jgi:hypothetical protein